MSDHEAAVREQYATSERFRTRVALHKRFRVGDELWPRWMLDRMPIPDGAAVLELGCGIGMLWRANADRVSPTWRLFLTDFSDGMVREARAATSDLRATVDLAAIDAQAIPFGDASFDVVVAGHMLYHVPDRERAIREVHRVLRPDGVFHASTIGARYLKQVFDLLAQAAPDAPRLFEYAHAAFGQESGLELLRAVFGHVETEVFEERLRITEAEPVSDYLRSVTGAPLFAPGHLVALTTAIQVEIERRGALDVEVPAVLFTCRG